MSSGGSRSSVLGFALISFVLLMLLSSLDITFRSGVGNYYVGIVEGGAGFLDFHEPNVDLSQPLTLHPPIFWHLPIVYPSTREYAYPTGIYLPFWIPIGLGVAYRGIRKWRMDRAPDPEPGSPRVPD